MGKHLEPYVFDKSKFRKHFYHDRIYLDFVVLDHFGYDVNRYVFRYYDSLIGFLDDNTSINIYLTNNLQIVNFKYHENDILVNIDNFIGFCDKIGGSKKEKSRSIAFFGQHLSINNIIISEEEKKQFINENLTEKHLLRALKELSLDAQSEIVNTLISFIPKNSTRQELVSPDNFIKIFSSFLLNGTVQEKVLENLPQIQLNALRELKDFVENNLDKDETFFQNWIDEDGGKFRKKRCLIFGIEFLDPKREGEIMGRKRFDILATQGRDSHVLIELKSPAAKIFEIDTNSNDNDGYTTSYKISKDLSRAIPQILGYKRWYYQLNAEKIQELGIASKKKISDCIIVIGTRKKDEVWQDNFKSICESLSIKIWTYTDLIEKMENTIKNLEENLHL